MFETNDLCKQVAVEMQKTILMDSGGDKCVEKDKGWDRTGHADYVVDAKRLHHIYLPVVRKLQQQKI